MMDFERLVLIGALAAAVTVGGALNARVKDLVQQRDIPTLSVDSVNFTAAANDGKVTAKVVLTNA